MSVSFHGHPSAFLTAAFAIVAQCAFCQSACDLNQDGAVNIVDVQLVINMGLGLIPCTAAINGAGVCNSITVQRVIDSALGRACVTDAGPLPHSVFLSWTASISPDVTGYNVYRGTTSRGSYTRVNSALIVGTSYADTSVLAGQVYYYVATAVDNSNNESAYSNEALAIIPSP